MTMLQNRINRIPHASLMSAALTIMMLVSLTLVPVAQSASSGKRYLAETFLFSDEIAKYLQIQSKMVFLRIDNRRYGPF